MELVDDSALRLKLRSDHARYLQENVKRSQILSVNGDIADMLFCWDIAEMQTLARVHYNINIPSPIIRDYKWPGLYTPFNHQKITSQFLSLRDRAFCFNEAGTGKTSSVIWAADYLMSLGLIRRVLIVCPLSIMYSAWQADIFKTAMHRSVGVAYNADPNRRRKIISGEHEFVITNYEGVGIAAQEIGKSGFDLIVVDEANGYKNVSTKRWRVLNRLLTPDTKLWMLTGTPAAQSPLDAFGLAKLVAPSAVPRTHSVWRDRVMTQVTRFKWLPKPTARAAVFAALQPAIRFTKAECLDLPPVVYQTRDVPLTLQVSRYYKALKTQLLIEAAGEEISAVHAGAALSKLLQISGGAVYTDKHDVVEFDVSPRLKALMEVLDETEHKVLVFVPFRHTIDLVAKHLTKEGITSEQIHGDVSARERANIINRFQTMESPRVLVIQPQSASHGVTLTAANTVVFWSPVMSVETYIQCIARIDRVGQVNHMTVVHLQGSEVERKMYAMLQGKVDMHEKLVDLYKQELES